MEDPVRRSQRQALGREGLGVATPGDQHGGDTGPRQHAADGATDGARTDNHVSAFAWSPQCLSNAIARAYVPDTDGSGQVDQTR